MGETEDHGSPTATFSASTTPTSGSPEQNVAGRAPSVVVSYAGGEEIHSRLSGWAVAMPSKTSEFSRHQLLSEIEHADALVCLGDVIVDKALLEAAGHLKVVARIGVGYDNVDVEACSAAGVVVTVTQGGPEEATAEVTIGLMFAACRHFSDAQRELMTAPVQAWEFERFRGKDVAGSTLGLVGYGRIAKAVERRAYCLDMKVLHHARHNTGSPGYVSVLEDLLAECDVLSMHVPASRDTYHLINARRLSLFRDGAVLINTSRGSVLDEAAVAEALRSKKLFAVGLDVFENEPCTESPLRGMEHAILLPHIGGNTFNSYERMVELAISSVKEVMSGGIPPSAVNAQPLRRLTSRV